jgi:hypothetical protein
MGGFCETKEYNNYNSIELLPVENVSQEWGFQHSLALQQRTIRPNGVFLSQNARISS